MFLCGNADSGNVLAFFDDRLCIHCKNPFYQGVMKYFLSYQCGFEIAFLSDYSIRAAEAWVKKDSMLFGAKMIFVTRIRADENAILICG